MFWLFPTLGHLWYLVRRFGFIHISSILFLKERIVLIYINNVKYRHGIGLRTTCWYLHCVKKTGLNVRAFFLFSILTVITSTAQHIVPFFAWKFYYFTCLSILEGYIVRNKTYDDDKCFSITSWENQLENLTQKWKKYTRKKRKVTLINEIYLTCGFINQIIYKMKLD